MTWITDTDGLCTQISQSWCSLVGRSTEQELGRGWADHLRPEDRERVLAEVEDAMGGRLPFIICYWIRRHDGKYLWMRSHGKPWTDAATGLYSGYRGGVVADQVPAVIERRTECASILHLSPRRMPPVVLVSQLVSEVRVNINS